MQGGGGRTHTRGKPHGILSSRDGARLQGTIGYKRPSLATIRETDGVTCYRSKPMFLDGSSTERAQWSVHRVGGVCMKVRYSCECGGDAGKAQERPSSRSRPRVPGCISLVPGRRGRIKRLEPLLNANPRALRIVRAGPPRIAPRDRSRRPALTGQRLRRGGAAVSRRERSARPPASGPCGP